MEYFCDSESYLDRAKACLGKNEPQYLFYAAFELRCFVESRQHDYLEAQEKYRKSLPSRWKIGKQSAELRRIFNLDKIQKITNTFDDGLQFVGLYIPVSKSLKNNAERLGKLLHAREGSLSEQEFGETRTWLGKMLDHAGECQSGNMLSPVLYDKSTQKSIGAMTITLEHDKAHEFKHRARVGALMMAKVEYVDFETELP